MIDMSFLVILGGCALGSWLLTGLVRHYARTKSILDVPNERSSHTVPTPRGGGLAIGVMLLGGILVAGNAGLIERSVVLALVVGGVLVAGIGWIDDHSHVAARWRSLVHILAAIWAVWVLQGVDSLRVGSSLLSLHWAGSLLAVVGIVWLINLYNFMDGIDGLAGGEAVLVGLLGGVLAWFSGTPSIALAASITAASAAGFLAWNWAPAKIFMGDVGSGLLGYTFGVLSIASETRESLPLILWIVLLGVFVFDATITLIRRVISGERWYHAHKSHAYQRAVQVGWTHPQVTAAVLSITVGLGVLAALGVWYERFQLLVCGIAVIILSVAYRFVERIRPMYYHPDLEILPQSRGPEGRRKPSAPSRH